MVIKTFLIIPRRYNFQKKARNIHFCQKVLEFQVLTEFCVKRALHPGPRSAQRPACAISALRLGAYVRTPWQHHSVAPSEYHSCKPTSSQIPAKRVFSSPRKVHRTSGEGRWHPPWMGWRSRSPGWEGRETFPHHSP